jgi:hypothetical protein
VVRVSTSSSSVWSVDLSFFGPTEYQGSGGAGLPIETQPDSTGRFQTTFTVPATVPEGGVTTLKSAIVTPGETYFASQPTMSGCLLKFMVTAR